MSFVERIKLTDGTEVAAVTTANQVEVAITNSANVPVAIRTLATGVVGTDQALVTNTVIHGQTTGGGGGYVDVKVTPSGSLVAETTIAGLDATVIGQKTMANSLPVVIASDQSVISVDDNGSTLSVDDGGGSITVDNASLTALNDTITSIGGVTLPTKMVAVGGMFGIGETRVLQLNDDGYLITESAVSNLVTHDNIASTGNWFSIAGYASSSTPTAVAGGDYSRIWTTLNGAVNIADGNSSITVDGTIAATQSGTWNITNVSGTVSLPTGASTSANQSTIITALQLLDDTVVTDNAAFTDGTTKLSMVGYIFDEVAGTTLTENDVAAARIDAKRAQIGTIEDGTTRGRYATVTAANALKVDGSSVTQPVSGTVSITANSSVNLSQVGGTNVVNGGTAGTQAIGGIQAHDAAISNNNPILCGSYYTVTPADVASGDVTRTWASPKGALLTGAKYEAAPSFFGDTVYHLTLAQDGRLRVDVDFTGKSITTVGNNAHDAVDSGNPNKIGAKAIAHGTNPTAVADADRTNLYANRHGILWTIGGHPNLQSAEYITTAAQTNDNVLPLISAGTKYVITGVTVTASAANTVNTSVRLGFGTTGVPTQGASAADAVTKVILSHPGIAPGSGVSKGHSGGIVGIGEDGEELYIVCSVPTGGSVVVQVDYYTIES